MKLNFKRALLPNLLATGLLGVTFLPAQPAAADDQILRDVGIGAAAGIVTGAVTHNGSFLKNGINGAAAGAAVNGANVLRNNKRHRNIIQDVGVGAAAGTVSGAITNRNHTGGNALNGAAAGAAINLLTR